MVSITTIGKSFDGLVRYQYTGRRDQPVNKQAEILASSGVSIESAAEMISDFNLGKAVNPGLGYPVWHTSLSFNPTDAARLDSDKMRTIAEEYLQKMGLDNTQYVIVRHRDQPDNQHLHIIANRVDYDGKTIDDGRNFYRSKLALQELVAEHGLTPPKGKRPELQHPERLRGTDLARHEMLTIVDQAVTAETQRPQLLAILRAAGLGVEERFDKAGRAIGISFEKDGYKFKGSELGRHLSSAGIDKQLAANALKQQAAVTVSDAITVSRLLASAALGSGVDEASASPEKAGSMKLSEMPVEQLSTEESVSAVVVSKAVGDGQFSPAVQQVTTEQDRIEERAVAAAAAVQREKKLIADYEEQANQADRRDDVTRMAELRFEEIPAAQKRLAAYEAEAKSTLIGIEILAGQEALDIGKVQKGAHDTLDEQLTVSIVPEPSATTLPTQQPVTAQVMSEETPVSKAPLEISPPVAPHHAVAMQAEEIGVSIPELQQELTPQVGTILPTPKVDDYLQEVILAVSFSEQETKTVLPEPQNANATAQQPPAQPAAQRQVDEEAAREVLAAVRREQALLEAARRDADQAERRLNIEKLMKLQYDTIPAIEQRLADYRKQVEATPVGRNLLAEQDQAQDKAAKEAILAAQEEKKAAEAQAAEQLAAQVAVERIRRERTLLEVSGREALQAEQQGDNETAKRLRGDVIPQAERRLAGYQLQAEATVLGQTLLAELNAQEKARQLAGEVLSQLAAKRGFISHEEFNQKATGSGYHLPPKSNGQPQQVVELSSGRQFDAPLLGGEQFEKVITKAMQVEMNARAHQKTELNALEEARARYGWGGKEVVRIRVSAAQVESLQKNIGSNMLHPDAKPGADGRIGINLIYNPHSDDIAARVSRVVAWARKTGGEVFEQTEEAFRRERNAKGFDSNLPTTPEKKSDREIGS